MSIKYVVALPLLSLLAAQSVYAQEPVFAVEWDAVSDLRVGLYEVHIGPVSGEYDLVVDSTETTAVIPDAGYDDYFVAVRACKADKSMCSEFSNEISKNIPIGKPGNLREAVSQLQGALSGMNEAVAEVSKIVDDMP